MSETDCTTFSNGANFELLPVTINSAGATFIASLRMGIIAGLELSLVEPNSTIIDAALFAFNTTIAVGIEAGVFIDVAKFNITASSGIVDGDCDVRVTEEFQMALGAKAGAYLAVYNYDWGAELEASTAFYTTTLMDVCAMSKTATVTTTTEAASPSASAIQLRDSLETTTTTTEVTYTAKKCLETTLVNCPVSLQTTIKNTVTSTLTATITSGVAVFATDEATVETTAFGTNAKKISGMSGTPTPYVEKSTGKNGGGDGDEDGNIFSVKTGGVDNKIIIGVSLGLGVPMLIGLIIGLM